MMTASQYCHRGLQAGHQLDQPGKTDAFTPSLGLDEGHLKTFIVDVTKEEQVKAFVDGARRLRPPGCA